MEAPAISKGWRMNCVTVSVTALRGVTSQNGSTIKA